MSTDESGYLTGKLLLAMPGMGDPRFHRAVIYVCAHDENGAMGLVVNYKLPDIQFQKLIDQLDLGEAASTNISKLPVMNGGPVETGRGFLLHSNDFNQDDTITVDDNFSVTGTIDALKAVVGGNGPERMLFILGYAGWDAGQLDREIQLNAWLTLDSDKDIIFNKNADQKWDLAIAKLGIDPSMLSVTAGTA